ncbi:group I truncated hemoglobin [Paenibacillus rigui]|uniref:Group 1 truncated hemoglobin n=1 Tax=Paenibacillus rigui TaxID=554312 RepID=A0A229UPL2_9BACL|nr:group 1 truncated hemoglobin [Paenibacillus rigui]OXM85426.1 group 1 truncated hemoglobin [Paenibacillus rigui]
MSANGEADEQNLYQRLGGQEGVREIVRIFYEKVLGDPNVNSYFKNTDMAKLAEHQTVFISFAVGGPEYYTGQSLTQAHEALNIASGHFDQVVKYLVESLLEAGVAITDIDAVAAKLVPLKSCIVRQS